MWQECDKYCVHTSTIDLICHLGTRWLILFCVLSVMSATKTMFWGHVVWPSRHCCRSVYLSVILQNKLNFRSFRANVSKLALDNHYNCRCTWHILVCIEVFHIYDLSTLMLTCSWGTSLHNFVTSVWELQTIIMDLQLSFIWCCTVIGPSFFHAFPYFVNIILPVKYWKQIPVWFEKARVRK